MLGNISFHYEKRSDNTLPIKKSKRSTFSKESDNDLIQMSQKGRGLAEDSTEKNAG